MLNFGLKINETEFQLGEDIDLELIKNKGVWTKRLSWLFKIFSGFKSKYPKYKIQN